MAVLHMRLAYLVSQYPTVTHTFVLREIRTLRDLGMDVDVISLRGCDRPEDQLSGDELEECRRSYVVLKAGLPSLAWVHLATLLGRPISYLGGAVYALRLAGLDLRKMFWNLMYFGESVAAGAWAARRGIRHLHSHFTSTVALLAARVFPLTFSATIHGPDEFADVVGYYLAQKVARAAFLCAISNYARSQLMRASDSKYWSKLEVVPLGVDPDVFCPPPHRDNSECFEILSVGRLAPTKGQQILVAAIDQLVQEGRRCVRLRLVGDGPSRLDLERNISERQLAEYVRLEGACNQDRVRGFYREADLFVMSSFAEGVPVVLMEAMAMELPCIATWITGVPELIRDGVDGWLIPPADPGQLAAAIRALMDDPVARRRLARSARERIVEKYNLARNVARLAEVFRNRLDN